MSDKAASPPRFVALDSWRGIAACCVAVFHFHLGVNSHFAELTFFRNASLFVDFFFVLSGFVIFANYAERLTDGFGFWKFMLLRFARLYPLHLFVLMIFVGFEAMQVWIPQLGGAAMTPAFSQPGENLTYIISSLFLVHAMGLFPDNIIAFNAPSWSISVEFYVYALFALILITMAAHIRKAVIATGLIAVFILYVSGAYLSSTFEWGFVRGVYGFAAGALSWYIVSGCKSKIDRYSNSTILWSALEAICILAIALHLSLVTASQYHLLIVPLFMATIFVFSRERGYCSKILKHKSIVLVGTVSYSIYMLHAFIAGKAPAVARLIGHKWPEWGIVTTTQDGDYLLGANMWQGDLMTIGYLLCVTACSIITYKCIEEPARRYSKRKLIRKKKDDKQRA